VRLWWLVLVLTVSAVVTILVSPPMSGHGEWCDDATALILISPGYSDGELAGSDPAADRSTCAKAAWRLGGLAVGLGVVGGAATAATRRVGLRRRAEAPGAGGAAGDVVATS